MNKNAIYGSLLGEGYLEKGKRSKNARFKFKQSVKHMSYVKYMLSCLGELTTGKISIYKSRKPSRINGKISHSLDSWNGEFCESATIWSRASDVFTKLHEAWYSCNNKVVPLNLVLNTEILAHWFVEDGTNNISVVGQSKGASFATNAFTENECEFLVSQLKNMGFSPKIYSSSTGPTIRIMAESYFDFMDSIRPHVLEFGCFDYKVDVSLAPKNRAGEKWRGPKLNLNTARKMRQLFLESKPKLSELAKTFNVSVSTVGKIVNNQMYKESDSIKLSGQAEVKIGYKYGN
jgi:hypothetical protein